MKVPVWVAELARDFWTEAREIEPFPRNLRGPIARAVPMSVMPLPNLSISSVLHWMHMFEISCTIRGRDRQLKACLIAWNGCGFAFIDDGDSEAEQRFSLAHELAHFLRDYQHPRRKAIERLGDSVLEVLDGQRSPTMEERLDSLLRSVPFGVQVHLLERDARGNPATSRIADAEECADRLAFELLAPAQHVFSTANNFGPKANRKVLDETLVGFYGLPELQAAQYAKILLPSRREDALLLRLRNM